MKRIISLTFDLEEFSLPLDYGKEIGTDEMLMISYKGCKELRKLLDKFNIKVTLFTSKVFARTFPHLIKKFSKEGHEIALHSDTCNFRTLLGEKKFLENVSKNKILGFRMHKLTLPDFKTLRKIGIKYDTSLHPTYVPERYNNLRYSLKPFMTNHISEIPISVTPFLRLPISFVWSRNFGINYMKLCTFLIFKKQNFINLYFHPWEFVKLDSFGLPFYITRNTGRKMSRLLGDYIKWCLSKNMQFCPLRFYDLFQTK